MLLSQKMNREKQVAEAEAKPARRSIGAQRSPASEEAILQAAEAVLLEGGLSSFSIEAVARRARAGKPTIYRWWPSKAALLLDVYQHHKQAHFAFEPVGDIREDLKGFLEHLFSVCQNEETGALLRSVIAEAQADTDTAAALAAYIDGRFRLSSEMVRRAQARGEVRADTDPLLVTEMLASFVWGRLLTGRLDNAEGAIATVVDTVVAGIKA